MNLTLEAGINGLLGPNGAGKSTLLAVIATLRNPASGSVELDGLDLHGQARDELRRRIGFLPQRFDLMRWSSVERNVAYAAWAQGVNRDACYEQARRALEIVDLVDMGSARVGTLSGGQRQRVGIACSLAHRPQVLLLDEPTAGLDPAQRVQIRSFLSKIADQTTVFLSTHIVEDLASLSANVAIMTQGVIAFTGSVDEVAEFGMRHARPGMSHLEAGYTALLAGSPTTRG